MLTRFVSPHFALALVAALPFGAAPVRAAPAPPTSLPANGRELGRVWWERDFEEATRASRATGRPLFLLFQEIPGCAECVQFGEIVLDHPGLADVIERDFTPVVVRNNDPGIAAEILERFEEAAWSSPVVRFVDADGADLVPRKEGVFTSGEIAERMIAALEAARRPVPEALRLFAAELNLARLRRAAFSTPHPVDGEAALGGVAGVVGVRAAWADGREDADPVSAVDVVYNEAVVCEDALETIAAELGCSRIGAAGLVPAGPDGRLASLGESPVRYLPLTPAQAARINSALHAGADPAHFLTARQVELAQVVDGVLARDAGALADLERPEDIGRLPEYERTLVRRLQDARTRHEFVGRN